MKNRSPKLSQFQMSLDTARSARLATASVPEDTVPISRSRPDSLHRTPAGFTALALDGYGLCDIVPARSTSAASYLVSVRRVATLLHVSSRQSLTVLPPASAAQRCSSAFLYHGLGSLTLGRPGRHDAGLPREEPGGGKPHARICEGESRMVELLDHNSAPPARNPSHQTYRSFRGTCCSGRSRSLFLARQHPADYRNLGISVGCRERGAIAFCNRRGDGDAVPLSWQDIRPELCDRAADLAEILEYHAKQHGDPRGDVAVTDPGLRHRSDKGHAFVLVNGRQGRIEAGASASLYASLSAIYQDECMAFIGSVTQSGIRNGDVTPGVSVLFSVVFKNLGEIGGTVAELGANILP